VGGVLGALVVGVVAAAAVILYLKKNT